MPRTPTRLLSFAMVVAGGALLVAAAFAGEGQRPQTGGILRVVGDDDVDSVDPAQAYSKRAWQIEYVTGLVLLGHRDAGSARGWDVVPEAAAYPRISRDGRVYTFRIRPGFRFSNGKPVTAASFAYALNRALQPRLASTGGLLLSLAGVVGADAVLTGNAKRASGIRARGRTLVVRLKRANPAFALTFVLPLFQAAPQRLPAARALTSTEARHGLPSAGPYYVAERRARTLTLRRNPYYHGRRPHRLAGMRFTFGVEAADAYQRVESGSADYALDLPPEAHAELGAKYGTRSGRYRVNPAGCLLFLGLRTDSSVFAGNAQLRQALNFAVDRGALTDVYTSAFGAYAVSPTDQYITPGFPGFRDSDIYPLGGPNVERARALAQGHMAVSSARFSASPSPLTTQVWTVVRGSFARIGFDVPQSPLRRRRPLPGEIYPRASCAGSADPAGFLEDVFVIGAPSGVERRIAQVLRLRRSARLQAFARLDEELASQDAPAIAWGSVNDREFFSARVDPRSIVYQPFVGGVDFAALALR